MLLAAMRPGGSPPSLVHPAESIPSPPPATSAPPYSLISRWGAAKAVDVRMNGHFAFVAAGGLDIYDLADPSHPLRVSSIGTRGSAFRLAVFEGTVFVATHRGLTTVDVHDPAHPAVLGQYTNPAAPFPELFGLTVARVAALGPPYLFLTDVHSLQILDASDPAHPHPVGAYEFKSLLPDRVRVAGNYAYVIGQSVESGDPAVGPTSMAVVNIANPAAPKVVGRYSTDGNPVGLDVSGTRAYLFIHPDDPDARARLEIIDIQEPILPKRIGSLDVGSAPIAFSAVSHESPGTPDTADAPGHPVDSQFVYLLDRDGGLMMVDATDPAHSQLLGGFGLPPVAFAMAFSENIAIVANGDHGIRVFDASRLPNLDEVYAQDWPDEPDGKAFSFEGKPQLAVTGTSLIISALSPGPSLRMVGLTTDGILVPGQRFDIPCDPDSLAAVADPVLQVYLACVQQGVRVLVPVTAERQGVGGDAILGPAGQWVKDSPAMRVSARENELIAEDGDGVLHVLDVSDPSVPVEKPDAVPLEYAFSDKVATLYYIWAAEGAKGVRVYSRTGAKPARPGDKPDPVATIPTLDTAWGLALNGDQAAIADGWAGVLLLDLTDPLAPKEITRLDVPGEARAVAFLNDRLIVLTSAGVFVYSLPAPIPPGDLPSM